MAIRRNGKPAVIAAGQRRLIMFNRAIVPQGRESGHVSLVSLLDLIDALESELEAQPGLTALWAAELRRELVGTLGVTDGG